MTQSLLSHVARSRVQIHSLQLKKDDYNRPVAHLRLRQPSSGAVVSAVLTKAPLIKAIMEAGRDVLWTATLDRSDKARMVLIDARRASQ